MPRGGALIRLALCVALALAAWLSMPSGSRATCIGLGCTCSVVGADIAFGAYDPLSFVDVDSTGDIEVTCGALVLGADIAYEIQLDAGNSGTFAGRTMTNGSHDLTYNLFTEATHTTVWGDGTGGTSTKSDSYTIALIQNHVENYTVFARLFSGQNVSAGLYSDTITVTVIF